jgi:predicted DNA-binding transcriptional regulator AlpA
MRMRPDTMTTATATATDDREVPLPDRLLTPADLATLFGVGESSIRGWTRAGRLPRPIRIGKAPRWMPRDILTHLGL